MLDEENSIKGLHKLNFPTKCKEKETISTRNIDGGFAHKNAITLCKYVANRTFVSYDIRQLPEPCAHISSQSNTCYKVT